MTLKQQLDNPLSTVRVFLDDRLPNTGQARAWFRAQMVGATTVVPDESSGRAPFSLLGHAISARLLWELAPAADGSLAGVPADALRSCGATPDLVSRFAAVALTPPGHLDPHATARVAWIAGVLDMLHRSGRYDNPHAQAIAGATTWDELLGTAPSPWVTDIVAVTEQCLPLIEPHRAPGVVIAPTFDGSASVGGADADYITGTGNLVDIKASKNLKLRLRDLEQIVVYALLDWDDTYRIDTVTLLLARQRRQISWRLHDLVTAMAGHTIDMAEIRDDARHRFQQRPPR